MGTRIIKRGIPYDKSHIKHRDYDWRHPERRIQHTVEETYPLIQLDQIYGEVLGIDNSFWLNNTGKNWVYSHPVSILYSILTLFAGIGDTRIDDDQWDTIYKSMGVDWVFGYAFSQKKSIGEILTSCLRESNLVLFNGFGKRYYSNAWRTDNRYRLFKLNTAKTTPDMVFSDKEADIYLMKDFRWEWTKTVYNLFNLKYAFNHAIGDYQKIYKEDRTSDSDLQTSYEKYRNTEIEYPNPQFDWIRYESVMDLWFAEAKKYWKQLKVWIEFETSLVGCLLELGDTIQVDHSAQTWAQADKDFQVVELEQMGNSVRIKAIEVIK